MKSKLWEKIESIGIEYQNSLNNDYKKNNGIYYTSLKLAEDMINSIFKNMDMNKPIYMNKVLEPCGGIGNFIFCYLKYIYENFNLEEYEIKMLFENIYYCESDDNAKSIYMDLLIEFAMIYFNFDLSKNDIKVGESLVFNLLSEKTEYISIDTYFGNIKFDIIITNPPYKSLRAEKRHYSNEKDYEKTQKIYSKIKEEAKKIFPLSSVGSNNLYKYFVEEIIKTYSSDDSLISILLPSGILKDKSCLALRKYLLENFNLKAVGNIPENMGYVLANQSLAYLTFKKKGELDYVNIINYNSFGHDKFTEKFENIIDIDSGYSILILKEEEYSLLKKLSKFKKIKDFDFIKNLRGELDLTIDSRYIITENTGYPLVKGRNIKKYGLNICENGFVSEEFIKKSSKSTFIYKDRIACQQIVNAQKEDRIIFAPIPRNYVLGNSCNFISIEDNRLGINTLYLLGILNSDIINWYFKLFSSNNHVNNYEINNFPLPIGNQLEIKKITTTVSNYLNSGDISLVTDLNRIVNDIINNQENTFAKDSNSIQLSFFDSKIEKSKKIKEKLSDKKYVLNNKGYKLSELDIEIIESVPQGGNWKNIPQETINKSKRLLGIQKTGGRTTLYGRLRLDKPSYTITTYFNRPGNGCYIHPIHNRVLTTREAARLQSFDDSYYFLGNQKDILNQIGNAVPPIIGYLFGRLLKEKLNIKTSSDLFSGAGGVLSGMRKAGIKHILATDIDKSACNTLRINNPNLYVLEGDITDDLIKEEIISKSILNKVDLICGGPPCQGFSLAGFRSKDDPRNRLFRDFYDIVKCVMPKVILFENVVGLLSYNNGSTYKEIQEIFKELGYNVYGKVMKFNEYGIPQKRNRVIIVGIRNDLNIEPLELFPEPIITLEDNQITVFEAIGNLLDITINSDVEIVDNYNSTYEELMGGIINESEFLENISKSRN